MVTANYSHITFAQLRVTPNIGSHIWNPLWSVCDRVHRFLRWHHYQNQIPKPWKTKTVLSNTEYSINYIGTTTGKTTSTDITDVTYYNYLYTANIKGQTFTKNVTITVIDEIIDLQILDGSFEEFTTIEIPKVV